VGIVKKSSAPKDLIPFPRDARKAPVVFSLQPKGFKPATTPEELALWELWMVERVGFSPDAPILAATRSVKPPLNRQVRTGFGGISGSNGGWDD